MGKRRVSPWSGLPSLWKLCGRILKEVNGGMVAEEVRILEMSRLHCFSSSTPSISSWMGGAKEEKL